MLQYRASQATATCSTWRTSVGPPPSTYLSLQTRPWERWDISHRSTEIRKGALQIFMVSLMFLNVFLVREAFHICHIIDICPVNDIS